MRNNKDATGKPILKDGINNYLVHGTSGAVNAAGTGTKAASHHQLSVGAGRTASVWLRLSAIAPTQPHERIRWVRADV